jgi:hypothetical protein
MLHSVSYRHDERTSPRDPDRPYRWTFERWMLRPRTSRDHAASTSRIGVPARSTTTCWLVSLDTSVAIKRAGGQHGKRHHAQEPAPAHPQRRCGRGWSQPGGAAVSAAVQTPPAGFCCSSGFQFLTHRHDRSGRTLTNSAGRLRTAVTTMVRATPQFFAGGPIWGGTLGHGAPPGSGVCDGSTAMRYFRDCVRKGVARRLPRCWHGTPSLSK